MGCSSSRPAARPTGADPRISRGYEPPTGAGAASAAAAAAAAGPPPRAKLVLLGDSGVGKTCLVNRYVRNAFDPASRITVGAAFVSHNVSLPSGRSLKLEIWDTAGQERYLALAPLYYRGAHAALVVYDVGSAESFAKARFWIQELQRNAGAAAAGAGAGGGAGGGSSGAAAVVLVLVGNKSDLPAAAREVGEDEARAFADAQNALFFEASAKTAAGVDDVFAAVAAKLAGGGLPVSVRSVA